MPAAAATSGQLERRTPRNRQARLAAASAAAERRRRRGLAAATASCSSAGRPASARRRPPALCARRRMSNPVAITVILTAPVERRIDDGAEDDVGVFVRRFLNDGERFVDLHQRHVGAAGHVDDDAAGAVDRGVFEQRARDRALRRVHARASRPRPMAVPIIATPMPDMIVFTSAKSRLISPARG